MKHIFERWYNFWGNEIHIRIEPKEFKADIKKLANLVDDNNQKEYTPFYDYCCRRWGANDPEIIRLSTFNIVMNDEIDEPNYNIDNGWEPLFEQAVSNTPEQTLEVINRVKGWLMGNCITCGTYTSEFRKANCECPVKTNDFLQDIKLSSPVEVKKEEAKIELDVVEHSLLLYLLDAIESAPYMSRTLISLALKRTDASQEFRKILGSLWDEQLSSCANTNQVILEIRCAELRKKLL